MNSEQQSPSDVHIASGNTTHDQTGTRSASKNAVFAAAEKISMPQVLVCHVAAMDVSNGKEARFFDHWMPPETNNHILGALGRRLCLVDERFSRGEELKALIHSFEMQHEYDSDTTLRLWYESIKEWFNAQEWSEEDVEHFNVIVTLLRRDAVQVLEFGQAQMRISLNRLRLKNVVSIDGAREFFQDRIKARLQKRITGKELFTRQQWSWTTGEHQISCRFEETVLQGVTRCLGLASDIWLPNEVETLVRAGSEATGSRKNVCEETRQAFGIIGQRPRGSVMVVDVLPQELDTPDLDEIVKAVKNARRASQVGKGVKGAKMASNYAKGTVGFTGKVIAGLMLVGAIIAGAAVVKAIYDRYHAPQRDRAAFEEEERRRQAENQENTGLPENTPTNDASLLDTASLANPLSAADTLGLKPSMTPPTGKEVWFNEDFYRRNRETLLRGGFKEVPFVVKEFPGRFISFAAQQTTFIPIALIRSSLFRAENIRVEVLPYSVAALALATTPTSSKAPPQLASANNTAMNTAIAAKNIKNIALKNAAIAKLPTLKKSPFEGLFRIDKQPQATTATQNFGRNNGRGLKDSKETQYGKDSSGGAPLLANKQLASKEAAVPKSTMPKPPQVQQVTRYGILFDKPLPIGRYIVKLYHIEKGQPDTSLCEWRVIESPFTKPSLKSMQSTKFYYGKPLSLRAKLVPELLDFYTSGTNNFRVRYQFGVESPHSTGFTPNTWTGPFIPAFAKKMNLEVVWVDTLSNYSIPLFTREVIPEQTPPDILCTEARAESDDAEKLRKTPSSKKAIPPPNFNIELKGIGVDFEVPMDADNKDPKKSKAVKATLNDIEAETPASIDFTAPETKLSIYNGEEPDPKVTWDANATNFKVINGAFDPKTGTFPITILVSNLPPKPPAETRILRGTVAINASAKIVNRLAGAAAKSASPPCIVPINITYK
ncbi:MAG: hypothetical protein EAZ92_07715 [Candidatus Kapaibacterium sp.]|nr:MAG: hypothetical protein EAZ92_07715 [Candidatus Kapabacteria bacterium]